MDSLAASAMYICFGSSIMIGMGVFGGVVNDRLGFENTCLLLACFCTTVGILISTYFLRKVKTSNTPYQNGRKSEETNIDEYSKTPLMDSVD